MRWSLLAVALALAAAGCLAPAGAPSGAATAKPTLGADGLYHYDRPGGNGTVLHVAWAPGAIGNVTVTGGPTYLAIQKADHILPLVEDGARFGTPGPYLVAKPLTPGQPLRFLVPPGQRTLQFETGREVTVLDPAADGLPADTTPLVSGQRMIALEQEQQARFPHRTPGHPNYAASQQFFADWFRKLGYDVEVDPYGASAVPCPVSPCPAAFANVVATKPGTGPHKDQVLFVAGGHYDMVPGTTFAAFDNTSGTVGTMELARALAPFKFDRTLKFALWGGEESGTLGSAFWIHTHPDAVARVVDYWNLDVIGMSWPAHPQHPSPVLVAAGPDVASPANDGTTSDPVSQDLLAFATRLQREWFGFPDVGANQTRLFRYEGVVSGERSGYARVNSQSDHESFVEAGIPAWFVFNGDTLKAENPVGIHSNRDTLENMTKVALLGADADLKSPLDPALVPKARDLLARSFEATVDFPLYGTLLTDLGLYTPPGVAARVP